MPELSQEERKKQELYRDARFTDQYDDIWQSVGKCVFCDLKEKYIFFEENGVVLTVNIHAYIDGHCMIIPRRHVRSPKDLTQTEWETIRKFSYIAKKLIKDVHHIDGMQIVLKDGAVAQSTVTDHIHFHCIPFDAPDLCQWNYRKLANTPLENQALYRKARKKIVMYDLKFGKKYAQSSALPVVCDLLIRNERGDVLLQHRKKADAFAHDWLSLPGGGVDDFSVPFEVEVCREVQEETGLKIRPSDIRLLTSRPGSVKRLKQEPHLKVTYTNDSPFTWNTYVLSKSIKAKTPLTPGDDCDKLVWQSVDKLAENPRISPEIRSVIELMLEQEKKQ